MFMGPSSPDTPQISVKIQHPTRQNCEVLQHMDNKKIRRPWIARPPENIQSSNVTQPKSLQSCRYT